MRVLCVGVGNVVTKLEAKRASHRSVGLDYTELPSCLSSLSLKHSGGGIPDAGYTFFPECHQ